MRNAPRGHYWFIAFTALSLALFLGGFPLHALGQKGTEKKPQGGTTTSGPKGTGKTVPTEVTPAPTPKVITNTITKEKIKEVFVKPNEGALVVFAVPGAKVTLTQLENNKGNKSLDYELKGKTLSLGSMAPGRWKVILNHEDYDPVEETVLIQKGKPTAYEPALVPKYGSIEIVGAPAGAKVFLDGQPLDPASYKSSSTGLTLPRVAVGNHNLKIAKEKYRDSITDLEVKPGEIAPVSGKLDPATVTLTINSVSGASVYVDNIEKGVVQPKGQITVEQLLPGTHTVRLIKEGYQNWETQITLSPENDKLAVDAPLVPIPTSKEGSWEPSQSQMKWSLGSANWKVDKSGVHISGEGVGLFATERSREFNSYRDFILRFDVQLTNGEGAVWVVRAKDRNNYYLFELKTSDRSELVFSLCRDGKCGMLDSKPVPVKIGKGESATITLEAHGEKFKVWLSTSSTPSDDEKGVVIGNFADNSFAVGGIGFSGKDNIEMLLKQFIVIPSK